MLGFFHSDDDELLTEAYRRFFHKVRNFAALGVGLLLIAWLVGVPHLQTTYKYRGATSANGIPRAEQKTEAWYFGVNGFHLIRAGQYGHRGCPYILFIPLEDCATLPWQSEG